jgi:hypothetical protein
MTKPLAEQFKEEGPRHILASIEKDLQECKRGYRGATHGINLCWAECANCWQAHEESAKRCEALEKRGEADAAEIGRLQERVTTLEERLDKAGKVVAELQRKVGEKAK